MKKSTSKKTPAKKTLVLKKPAAKKASPKGSGPSFDLIKQYTDFMKENDLVEMDFQSNEVSIRLRRYEGTPISAPVMSVSAAPVKNTSSKTAPETRNEDVYVVKSPFVGTFYRSPGPNQEPFIEEGKAVSSGDNLCIIEAMKLMNEIESDIKGRVVKCLVKDGTPVEFGEALFEIEKI